MKQRGKSAASNVRQRYQQGQQEKREREKEFNERFQAGYKRGYRETAYSRGRRAGSQKARGGSGSGFLGSLGNISASIGSVERGMGFDQWSIGGPAPPKKVQSGKTVVVRVVGAGKQVGHVKRKTVKRQRSVGDNLDDMFSL